MYRKFFKRFLDVTLSFCALVVLAIPMLIFAIIIKLDSKGPVLFWQKRVGVYKQTFMMPKFRTMYTETPADMPTHLLSDPQRWITPVGKIYRKLSIDELPQIWSILTGKMSIIGPRPELLYYTNQYRDEQLDILKVRPGITDYSSIRFVNLDEIVGGDNPDEMYEKLVLEKKNALRVHYAHTVSLVTDLKLFFGTVKAVLGKIVGLAKKDNG